MIKSILLTTILAITISAIASIPYASAVVVDGTIGVAEYANSVLVEKSSDLGGFYDLGVGPPPGGISFAGGAVNCHNDWRLFWDFDATNIYIAADPLGASSSCADAGISAHLLAILGDPNISALPTDCTGTFFNLNAHNFHQAVETCLGPGFEFEFQSSPPSSTETFVQTAVGSTITPIEWSNVRADLDKFGDTTYTGDLQCVWLRVSAFDSRSVDNAAGPGSRTIWLKLDPSTPPCGEESAADHFLGYEAKTTKKTPKFQKVTVDLNDQFEQETYKVEKTTMFFTPVDKNGEGIADPDTHLKGYKIKGPHTPVSNIVVTNQFGELLLNTVKVELLLVPTFKDLNADIPEPLMASSVDHFKCYKVKVLDDQRSFNQVTLVDQFVNKEFTVGKPKMLCNPVDKNGEGINNEDNHLMCYDVKDKFKKTNIHTHDQFGPETLDTKKIKQLCVPSEKDILP